MKEKTPHRCTGIDGIGQAAEINAAFAQFFYQNDQMTHTATQPVQFPDHQRVPF
ncbi:hypothetical protein NGUA18_04141 [Salmonella enterica]|nr:hypothetical protein NGUA18_04141 [Salmonella enterica]